MNKTFLTLLSGLLLISCQQTNKNQEQKQKNSLTETIKQSEPVVRKSIPFSGEFYQITNIGSPNIIFTEGDYSIEAEGSESMIKELSTDIDCNVLTVNLNNEEKVELNKFKDIKSNITLYISCPKLQIVAMCNTGSFHSIGTIHTSSMQVGCLGTGGIEMDSIITDIFKYEASGNGNAKFNYIKATGETTFLLSGLGKTSCHLDVTDNLFFDCRNNCKAYINGNVNIANISVNDNSKCHININADKLNVSVINSEVNIKGKIKNKNIQKGHGAKVTF